MTELHARPWTAVDYDASETVFRLRSEPPPGAGELFGAVPRTEEELMALAREYRADPERRRRLLDCLGPEWDRMDLPPSSRESQQLLEDPETRIIMVGQQPALAGGPLFLYGKALSASRLARRLREGGVPAVPVFWIADEDHDVGELEPGAIPQRDHEPWRWSVPFPPGRVPVSSLSFADDGEEISAAFGEALSPDLPERDWAHSLLQSTFDRSPGVGFLRFLLNALEGEGLLPVTPRMIRSEAVPWIEGELARPGALASDAAEAMTRQRALGLPVPIPRPADVPFFLMGRDGARHRLEVVDGGLRSRDPELGFVEKSTLEDLLVEDPARFSPDALLRPLIQDAIFEPFATILGPTEMAYHLQLALAYERRGIRRPLLFPRLRVRVLSVAEARSLRRAGVEVAEVTADVHPSRLVTSPVAEGLAEAIGAESDRFLELVESLENDSASAALAKRAGRLARRWRADVEKLKGAIHREVDDVVADRRQAVARIQASLWPGGRPAEREFSVLYFVARFGRSIFDFMGDSYDPLDSRPRVLILPEETHRA